MRGCQIPDQSGLQSLRCIDVIYFAFCGQIYVKIKCVAPDLSENVLKSLLFDHFCHVLSQNMSVYAFLLSCKSLCSYLSHSRVPFLPRFGVDVPRCDTKQKSPSENLREGSCASDGNRTRTGIAAHGIFLLLLLLHKPTSSVMLSRCSLDYFLTMRRIDVYITLLRLGPPCIVSTPFISRC